MVSAVWFRPIPEISIPISVKFVDSGSDSKKIIDSGSDSKKIIDSDSKKIIDSDSNRFRFPNHWFQPIPIPNRFWFQPKTKSLLHQFFITLEAHFGQSDAMEKHFIWMMT